MIRSAMARMGASCSRSLAMLRVIDLPVPSGWGRRVSLKRRTMAVVVRLQKDQSRGRPILADAGEDFGETS